VQPLVDDPFSCYQLSYFNGGGGSDKTRAIDVFRGKEPLFLTPTHSLAKEMRARGVKVQTYHSLFFLAEWPERVGQKYVPRIIIWEEVCTVPLKALREFLVWLYRRGVRVICCGGQGQPASIKGEMPHGLL